MVIREIYINIAPSYAVGVSGVTSPLWARGQIKIVGPLQLTPRWLCNRFCISNSLNKIQANLKFWPLPRLQNDCFLILHSAFKIE